MLRANKGFEAEMKLSIHGCRGSIVTASPATKKYGGNTSCYELTTDKRQFIFDAGSGFQNVNFSRNQETFLILSHFHHDHIQGLPFNSQLFDPANKVIISSDLFDIKTVKKNLQRYFSPPYFPIDLLSSLPNITFEPFDSVRKNIETDSTIESISLNHPGGCRGYKLTQKNRSFIYLCDNEFEAGQRKILTNFVEKADLLIWDGMFTDEELEQKKGWGHSSVEQAIHFNQEAQCKKVLIAHHAPHRTDAALDYIAGKLPETVSFAMEKLEIEV